MDFVTLIGVISRAIDLADALKRRFTEGGVYRRTRFGKFLGEWFYWSRTLDTETVQRYHYNINLWTKDEAMAWRESYISRCSAVSVAAAIFASVGLTALQLESMPDSHWSATALLTASMTLGILSVCAATTLQNSVTDLSNDCEVRLWLSQGLGNWPDYTGTLYGDLLLESSAATVALTGSPTLLLNLSVIAYFLGFGIYLLYGWKWAITDVPLNWRNEFIFYVAVIGSTILYIAWLWAGKIMDKDKVNQQFNLRQRLDTGDTDKKVEMLQKWTEIVEILTTSKDEEKKQSAREQMDAVLYSMRYNVDKFPDNTNKNAKKGKESRQESGEATLSGGKKEDERGITDMQG